MFKLGIFTVSVAFVLVGCGGGSGDAPAQTPTVSDITVVLKSENKDMLEALNFARSVSRDCNDGEGVVGPSNALVWNDELHAAAYEHSNDLAKSDTFSHYGSGTEYDITAVNNGDGPSYFYERIEHNGYGEYHALGENIAGGQSTIEDVMKAWLASPGHCANIMSEDFTEVGIAVVTEEDSTYGIYWTQNFGSKS
ncbi:MAG: CAP domain-containing protein [Epsilonproteobacteria bacterium]|nr:CAP domain-containing protein [Campylobacterota bacterium]